MKPRKTFALFAFLALTVWCGTLSKPTSAAGPAAPIYEIAFSSLGPINADIVIADADGNHAKPLLPHAGFDGNASFSSDGQWVVFTSERDGCTTSTALILMRLGSSASWTIPRTMTRQALSPDGRSLAFVSTRTGQADIWILDLATKKLRNLTNQPAGDFRPAWSPDGQWLAFTSDRDSRKPIIGGFLGTAIDRKSFDPRGRDRTAARHANAEGRRQSHLVSRRQAPALRRGGAR